MMPALLADCREEQYPCTRLYSVHKPCKQCLNEICFYRRVQGAVAPPQPPLGESPCFFLVLNPLLSAPRSLRRVYVINKEICVRTVCAHEELLRGKGQEGTWPPHTLRTPPRVAAPRWRGGC